MELVKTPDLTQKHKPTRHTPDLLILQFTFYFKRDISFI